MIAYNFVSNLLSNSQLKMENDYRDHHIQYLNFRIYVINKNELSPEFKNYFSQYIPYTLLTFYHTKNYRKK